MSTGDHTLENGVDTAVGLTVYYNLHAPPSASNHTAATTAFPVNHLPLDTDGDNRATVEDDSDSKDRYGHEDQDEDRDDSEEGLDLDDILASVGLERRGRHTEPRAVKKPPHATVKARITSSTSSTTSRSPARTTTNSAAVSTVPARMAAAPAKTNVSAISHTAPTIPGPARTTPPVAHTTPAGPAKALSGAPAATKASTTLPTKPKRTNWLQSLRNIFKRSR